MICSWHFWFCFNFAAIGLGLVTIAIAYTGELFGATLLQVSLSIFSTAGGPILGMLFLGILCPFANSVVCTCVSEDE